MKETEATQPKTETKAEPRNKWEVSGIWIVKSNTDYKFYVGEQPTPQNYAGALGGSDLSDRKAEERAMKIAVKKGLIS